ncbi:aldo/keto reductase [Kibdelosporangium philippinense]|uniref:Aldo/keto reductase n=1 Tax=Kibdelosporangium philippinense TaxID=211113 RepID=A0ABS8ZJ04_9PSEU|nr:aldo/keto reductase [Kibdelosporangium philippinense]MCE7007769.1 aldo/keto reductase [Kibdelosporangium philippinense]
MIDKRPLGRSGIEVSALGFGCWAIGGPWSLPDGSPLGWGEVDDEESIAAIRRAVELGVTFFDTADIYGTGRSERVLGRALAGKRDEVVLASKWGNVLDEQNKWLVGEDDSVGYMRSALDASLKRLGTDYLDLYQLHLGPSDEQAILLRDACEDLVKEGKIRGYAWSTDTPAQAELFAQGASCAAVQHELSVLHQAPEMIAVAEKYGVASINRTPLAMGLLGGRDNAATKHTGTDLRATPPSWLRFYVDGRPSPEWFERVNAIRETLTADGRTLGQGALGWIWARSKQTVPIPGFRTVKQAEENAGALQHGPLSADQMTEIDRLLS